MPRNRQYDLFFYLLFRKITNFIQNSSFFQARRQIDVKEDFYEMSCPCYVIPCKIILFLKSCVEPQAGFAGFQCHAIQNRLEKKRGGKYAKTLAKIQVSNLRFPQIYIDL